VIILTLKVAVPLAGGKTHQIEVAVNYVDRRGITDTEAVGSRKACVSINGSLPNSARQLKLW
jgi:hypothetical protein